MEFGLLAKIGVTYAFSAFLLWAGLIQTYYAVVGRMDTLGYGLLSGAIRGTSLEENEAVKRAVWLVMGPSIAIWGAGLAAVLTYLLLS